MTPEVLRHFVARLNRDGKLDSEDVRAIIHELQAAWKEKEELRRKVPKRAKSKQALRADAFEAWARDAGLTDEFSAVAKKHACTLRDLSNADARATHISAARLEAFRVLLKRGWSNNQVIVAMGSSYEIVERAKKTKTRT